MSENQTISMLKAVMLSTSKAVEKELDRIVRVPEGPEARVVEAMRYALFTGGKRLRPFLVMASADLFHVNKTCALRVAAAIECVHCYSLIHDDLPAMDDDDLRRGKPTVHKAFDEATAILAGDALLTLAFEILADEKTHSDVKVRLDLTAMLAREAGYQGMVGGQMIDMTAFGHAQDEAFIHRLQQMKTGALIRFAVESGAIMGHASARERQSLQGYAHDLGIVYQIVDDLLDVEGDPEKAGKKLAKDKDAGKATIVDLLGAERARQQAVMLADQAKAHLASFGERAALLQSVAYFAVNREA